MLFQKCRGLSGTFVENIETNKQFLLAQFFTLCFGYIRYLQHFNKEYIYIYILLERMVGIDCIVLKKNPQLLGLCHCTGH